MSDWEKRFKKFTLNGAWKKTHPEDVLAFIRAEIQEAERETIEKIIALLEMSAPVLMAKNMRIIGYETAKKAEFINQLIKELREALKSETKEDEKEPTAQHVR